jgi:hypothetical protein
MEAIASAYMDWDLASSKEGLGTPLLPREDAMVQSTLSLIVVDIFCEHFTLFSSLWFTYTHRTFSNVSSRDTHASGGRLYRLRACSAGLLSMLPERAQHRNHHLHSGDIPCCHIAVPPLCNSAFCAFLV